MLDDDTTMMTISDVFFQWNDEKFLIVTDEHMCIFFQNIALIYDIQISAHGQKRTKRSEIGNIAKSHFPMISIRYILNHRHRVPAEFFETISFAEHLVLITFAIRSYVECEKPVKINDRYFFSYRKYSPWYLQRHQQLLANLVKSH